MILYPAFQLISNEDFTRIFVTFYALELSIKLQYYWSSIIRVNTVTALNLMLFKQLPPCVR